MRLVFGFVLLVGIGLAGAAVYMAKDYIGQQQAQLAEAEAAKKAIVPVKDVYVVNKRVRYGQRLSLEDVTKVRWPVEAIPEGAFTSEEELFPKGPEIKRSILRTMEPNEAVMAIKVTGPGDCHRACAHSRSAPTSRRAFPVSCVPATRSISTGPAGSARATSPS